jgi:hypothetical protein
VEEEDLYIETTTISVTYYITTADVHIMSINVSYHTSHVRAEQNGDCRWMVVVAGGVGLTVTA